MIEELTLRGFKSYKTRQTVRFTQGVNKISGRNASARPPSYRPCSSASSGTSPGSTSRTSSPWHDPSRSRRGATHLPTSQLQAASEEGV